MGAELYICSIYHENRRKHEKLFFAWIDKRAVCKANYDEIGIEKAQEQVEKYHGLLFSEGYFRDSYNSTNLMSMFGLGYWQYVGDLLDEDSNLQPEQARQWLAELEAREDEFKSKLKGELWSFSTDAGYGEMESMFWGKYENLQALLWQSIELDEPIYCSI